MKSCGFSPPVSTVNETVINSGLMSSFTLAMVSGYVFVRRVTLEVADLGWADFDLDFPSSCLAAQPILPSSHLSKQNLGRHGRHSNIKNQVNSTQVHNHVAWDLWTQASMNQGTHLHSPAHWRRAERKLAYDFKQTWPHKSSACPCINCLNCI